jgi:hypothetical protein
MAERIDYYPSALHGIYTMQADSSRTFARHSHEEFGVGLIVRGAQRSCSGRGMVEAGPGDIIMVNPGEVHDGQPCWMVAGPGACCISSQNRCSTWHVNGAMAMPQVCRYCCRWRRMRCCVQFCRLFARLASQPIALWL